MKWILPVVALLLGACSHLPMIQPAAGDRRLPLEADCRSHFPQGRWQLVHTIHARLNGGRQAAFTGVIILSSGDRTIHCVLMTLEGMVLFEAVDDGVVSVKRAFGPFDNPHFAGGVMADICFLFLEPGGGMVASGAYDDGTPACRYRTERDRTVDLIQRVDGGWRMDEFDPGGARLRTMSADAVDHRGIASRMTLDAGGRQSYRLSMTLVDAVALP